MNNRTIGKQRAYSCILHRNVPCGKKYKVMLIKSSKEANLIFKPKVNLVTDNLALTLDLTVPKILYVVRSY